MRLAQAGQQFADLGHMLDQSEMAIGTQALKVDQATARALQTLVDEVISLLNVRRMAEQFRMRRLHRRGHTVDAVMPAMICIIVGKQGVDPGLSGFLVLKQQVGNPGKSRYHKNASIKASANAIGDEQCIAQLIDA